MCLPSMRCFTAHLLPQFSGWSTDRTNVSPAARQTADILTKYFSWTCSWPWQQPLGVLGITTATGKVMLQTELFSWEPLFQHKGNTRSISLFPQDLKKREDRPSQFNHYLLLDIAPPPQYYGKGPQKVSVSTSQLPKLRKAESQEFSYSTRLFSWWQALHFAISSLHLMMCLFLMAALLKENVWIKTKYVTG